MHFNNVIYSDEFSIKEVVKINNYISPWTYDYKYYVTIHTYIPTCILWIVFKYLKKKPKPMFELEKLLY